MTRTSVHCSGKPRRGFRTARSCVPSSACVSSNRFLRPRRPFSSHPTFDSTPTTSTNPAVDLERLLPKPSSVEAALFAFSRASRSTRVSFPQHIHPVLPLFSTSDRRRTYSCGSTRCAASRTSLLVVGGGGRDTAAPTRDGATRTGVCPPLPGNRGGTRGDANAPLRAKRKGGGVLRSSKGKGQTKDRWKGRGGRTVAGRRVRRRRARGIEEDE